MAYFTPMMNAANPVRIPTMVATSKYPLKNSIKTVSISLASLIQSARAPGENKFRKVSFILSQSLRI